MDLVCFLQILLSLTQVKHLAISMYKPFTESSTGSCGTVHLSFSQQKFSAFLLSWFWLDGDEKHFCGLSFLICQLPFHLFRFLPALHGCTRCFCIRPFINHTYFLFFFFQFSLLSHFSNLRDHWNHVEKSIVVAFLHAWRSKGWKRLYSPYFREGVLVYEVPRL